MIEMRFESVFRGVVEAMLPRFSDERLGLAVGCRVSFDDYGYERDGNTLAKRGALHISHFLHFLATRPGNYTKVYMYEDVSDQGTEGNPCTAASSSGTRSPTTTRAGTSTPI